MIDARQITMAPPEMGLPEEQVFTAADVLASRVFSNWLQRATNDGLDVRSVHVYAIHAWGKPIEIKMLHMVAEVYDAEGRKLDGVATLRGDTTDIVTILTDEDGNEFVVLVIQPRTAGAQARVVSDASGMIDSNEHPHAAALRELEEETGGSGSIRWEIIDLNQAVLGSPRPLLVSPGGSDERVYYALATARLSNAKIMQLHEKFGGAEDEGERVQISIVPEPQALPALLQGGDADLKATTGLLLYQQYKRR